MDSRTGDLYPTKKAALEAGVPKKAIVMLEGAHEAMRRVARKVRMVSRLENKRRKARRRQQKQSRQRNRR